MLLDRVVVAEIALALTLLISAGLLSAELPVASKNSIPDSNAENVLTAFIILPTSKYAEPRRQAAFFKEVVERIEALPGVTSAGGSDAVPLITGDNGPIRIEGRPEPRPGGLSIDANRPKITPDYFRAMGFLCYAAALHLGRRRKLAAGSHH